MPAPSPSAAPPSAAGPAGGGGARPQPQARKAKRGNGEGSLSRRSDGRWQASLMVAGRRQTVYGKTQKEVREKLAALQQQARTTGKLPERHTLGDLVALWLQTGETRWQPMTLQAYRRDAGKVLADLGERTPLSKITPARLQALMNRHAAHPRAAQRLYDTLRALLGTAVRWGWLPSNPLEQGDRPARRPRRREWWTPAQCAHFLQETAATRWGPLWALALATGCRLGELLALRWQDVGAGTLRVERTGQHIGAAWVVKEPKTASGRRTIPLTRLALDALQQQHVQQAQWRLRAGEAWVDTGQDTGLVFTTREGRPLERGAVARALRSAVQKAGLPPMTFHGFRHLHGSLALQAGAPLPLVSKHLGHASVAITAGVYSHALGGTEAVVRGVDRLLRTTTGATGAEG